MKHIDHSKLLFEVMRYTTRFNKFYLNSTREIEFQLNFLKTGCSQVILVEVVNKELSPFAHFDETFFRHLLS